MNAPFDRLHADLADLADEVRVVDLRDRTLRSSRNLGIRRTLLGAATAIAVLAIGAGTTFATVSYRQTGLPAGPGSSVQPTATSPSGDVTASASPPGAPSASPSASPAASGTGTVQWAVDPGVYVPASWLAPDQLPFNPTYSWVSLTPEPTIEPGPTSGNETSCSGMMDAVFTSGGNRHWQLWVFGDKRTGLLTHQLAAYQYFYPDAATAQQAFQQMQNQLPACATERQVDGQTGKPLVNTVHQTASIPNGFAFVHTLRTTAGQPASAPNLTSDNHEYLVQRGSIIALIEVPAADSTVDQWNNDQGVLQQMADHLCLRQHC